MFVEQTYFMVNYCLNCLQYNGSFLLVKTILAEENEIPQDESSSRYLLGR